MILLEHTAGQGSTMGATFEEIGAMIDGVKNSKRLGVCLDTCHLLASGYDLCSEDGYSATFEQFDALVGFDRLKVFHLNDSKKPCMSRVDRHEHIGKGCIGLEPFRRLLNDPRFDHLPMILETEKTEWREKGKVVIDPLDEMNLNTLRGAAKDERNERNEQEFRRSGDNPGNDPATLAPARAVLAGDPRDVGNAPFVGTAESDLRDRHFRSHLHAVFLLELLSRCGLSTSGQVSHGRCLLLIIVPHLPLALLSFDLCDW